MKPQHTWSVEKHKAEAYVTKEHPYSMVHIVLKEKKRQKGKRKWRQLQVFETFKREKYRQT